jgi:2-polyprenyl-3-methyl-5-hydroxy-6-metoxy-1,4-benzoquinol methylase
MSELIRDDFDRLALLDTDDWNHNNHYHPLLLKHLPSGCQQALEIGCGSGGFSRLLAEQSQHVLGLDLAPEMIRLAQMRSRDYSNLEYQLADVLQWDFPREKYDCIVSIATFHHLPFDVMLPKLKAALNPGGALLILDLFKSATLADHLTDIISIPMNLFLRLVKTGKLRESEAARAAWAAHGTHDVYLPLSAIRQACDQILPGYTLERHFLWRYSLIWKKNFSR